jgi:hypothetical protein
MFGTVRVAYIYNTTAQTKATKLITITQLLIVILAVPLPTIESWPEEGSPWESGLESEPEWEPPSPSKEVRGPHNPSL